MYSVGLFQDSDGTQYTVHELQEHQYYRLDICELGAVLHTDVDKIKFSIYRRKKSYLYGDPEIYSRFKNLKETVSVARLPEQDIQRGWEEGSYVIRHKRYSDTTVMETVSKAGVVTESTYKDSSMLLAMRLQKKDTSYGLTPMNAFAYDEIQMQSKEALSAMPYLPYSILRTRFNLNWLKDKDYSIVTEDMIARVTQEILDADPELMQGYDTETSGLDFNLYGEDYLVGIVISPVPNVSYYLPLKHDKFENLDIIDILQVLKALSTKNVVAFNKKFDAKVTKKFFMRLQEEYAESLDFTLTIHHDGYIAAVLNKPKVTRGSHSLKRLENERSGNRYLELDDIFPDGDIRFQILDTETTTVYACPDPDNTREVTKDQLAKLPPETYAIYEIECELADLKMEQEFWGFRVDEAKRLVDTETCQDNITLLESMIFTLTGKEFNIGSTTELAEILYVDMKAPVEVRTSTGQPSTSAKALKKIKGYTLDEPRKIVTSNITNNKGDLLVKAEHLNKTKYPLVVLIEKYREQIKLLTAFYNRIKKGSAAARYFTWVNQLGAESGRQSSPLHQIPPAIRKLILPDSSEHVIYDSDYGQIELRIIFWLSGETKMIALCSDLDVDIHRAIGSLISNKEVWEISDEERSAGKGRNFGVVYLISDYGLAEQRFGANPTKEQRDIAKDSIEEFFVANKRVDRYIRENRVKILEEGKINTFFYRYRYFEDIFDPDIANDKKAAMVRQGNNMPVQGTAADIMKIAEVNMNNYIKRMGWDRLVTTPEGDFPLVRVAISIHDEAIVMAHKSIPYEAIAKMKRDCMELDIEGAPPLPIDTAVVRNLYEGKKSSLAMPFKLRDKLIEDYERTGKSAITNPDEIPEQVIKLIDDFRDSELIGFMEELIEEYKTPEVVADNLRHPSFTHDMIARFHQSEEHARTHGQFSHLEAIRYSVDQYFEHREDLLNGVKVEKVVTKKMEEELRGDSDVLQELGLVSDTLFYVDGDGNIHYYTEDDELEEEDSSPYILFKEDGEPDDYLSEGKIERIFELNNMLIFDLEDLDQRQCDDLIKLLWDQKDSDGFYEVRLQRDGNLLNPGFRIETLDKTIIQKFYKECGLKEYFHEESDYGQTGTRN